MASTPFPSLVIRADGFSAQGSFAEAQADFLEPDAAEVAELTRLLEAKNVGVVAHFYMDPELQGVLSASSWPHIHISDSLVMADSAVKMVQAGARTIVVLGVDFMSENVRAILDAAGHSDVPVYRVAAAPIGCSLAESAESLEYGAYLTRASKTPRSLHVIYINTSLRTKAQAEALVPTITCTSSNVVKTVLQAYAEVPGLHVWFGPDTYMGKNLHELFSSMRELPPEKIAAVHPAHDRSTLDSLLERFHYFEQGTCIVHHMFGREVAERVRREHADTFVTAHLEVPGEMFSVALEAQRHDRGVVGSTSDILGFIGRNVDAAVAAGKKTRLAFVLGTEAGMITSIARRVRASLSAVQREGGTEVEVEIVFPVASEAVTVTSDSSLPIVPGVAGGEGCSTEGGCATCPYMKMNSLDALLTLLSRVGGEAALQAFEPRKYVEPIAGRTAAELGGIPILRMRALGKTGRLPEELVSAITTRRADA
jgi:quinolinate synthase